MKFIALIALLATGCNLFSAVEPQSDPTDVGVDASEDLDLAIDPPDAEPVDLPNDPPDGDVEDAGADAADQDASSIPDDWWDLAWSHRVAVTLDLTDLVAATGVPVPVAIPAEITAVSNDGIDLRIVDATGAILPFEVARWGTEPIVWVLMDIDPEQPGPHLWAYVGNAGAASAANPAEVWADFEVALHFDDAELGHNSADPGWAVQEGRVPVATNGLVGMALDTEAGFLQFPAFADTQVLDLDIGDQATFMACISTVASADNQTVLWKEGGCTGWSMRVWGSGEYVANLRHSNNNCNGWQEDRVTSPTPINDGQWRCFAGRMDRAAGTIDLVVDGQSVGSAPLDNSRTASGGQFRVGTNYDDSTPMLGLIDEAWITSDRRSDAWVAAAHAALLRGIAEFGPVESLP